MPDDRSPSSDDDTRVVGLPDPPGGAGPAHGTTSAGHDRGGGHDGGAGDDHPRPAGVPEAPAEEPDHAPPRPAGIPSPGGSSASTAEAAARRKEAERRRRDRARQALVSPWSEQRARRVRWIALLMVILGPIAGSAFALLLVPPGPSDVLPVDTDRTALLNAQGTVRGIDQVAGEAAVRLVLTATAQGVAEGLVDEAGALTEDLVLISSDTAGQGYQRLPAGQPPGTVGVTLALTSSRATRYPLDRYRSVLLLQVRMGDGDGEVVPLSLELTANDPGFTVDLRGDDSSDEVVVLHLEVMRRATVIGWAGFFVMVCWLLALSAASIGWTTIVRGISAPGWSLGFLIGVLFALPPLRNALPGSPPGGSLVDFAAFYWAVGIVALTLVLMIGSWNVRVRRAPHSPDSPRP